MVLNLFGTVAHFVLFESLHGPLLCGPPLLDHSFAAPRLKKKGLHFRVSDACPVIALIFKQKKGLHLWERHFCPDLQKQKRSSPLGEQFLP